MNTKQNLLRGISKYGGQVFLAVRELNELSKEDRCTVDGLLLGGIGEVFAKIKLGIDLHKAGTKDVDANFHGHEGETIQIKTTQLDRITLKRVNAKHLIVVSIKFNKSNSAIVPNIVFNGRSKIINSQFSNDQKTKTFHLEVLKELNS